jgi:hypothetical protein
MRMRWTPPPRGTHTWRHKAILIQLVVVLGLHARAVGPRGALEHLVPVRLKARPLLMLRVTGYPQRIERFQFECAETTSMPAFRP